MLSVAVDNLGGLMLVNSQLLQIAAHAGTRIHFSSTAGSYEMLLSPDRTPILRREKDGRLTELFTELAVSKIRHAMNRLFGWKNQQHDEPDHPLHRYG